MGILAKALQLFGFEIVKTQTLINVTEERKKEALLRDEINAKEAASDPDNWEELLVKEYIPHQILNKKEWTYNDTVDHILHIYDEGDSRAGLRIIRPWVLSTTYGVGFETVKHIQTGSIWKITYNKGLYERSSSYEKIGIDQSCVQLISEYIF